MSAAAEMPRFSRPRVELHDIASAIRSLPDLIDFNARENPNHLFCLQSYKAAEDNCYRINRVSHLQFKQAILRCSEWLKSDLSGITLPHAHADGVFVKGSPVAILMESSVGLLVHEMALMGLGVPVLLLSARLSPTAIHHLLVQTSATSMLVSPKLRRAAERALALFPTDATKPSIHDQKPLDELIRNKDADANCGARSICSPGHYLGKNDRSALIMHSSGTTGLPKPIHTSHRQMLAFATCHELPGDERDLGICLTTLPFYHGFGMIAFALSLGVGLPFCMPPPSMIPTGEAMMELLQTANARSFITVPSILEELSMLPENAIKVLKTLDFVAFGGGQLKQDVGERLAAAGVRLLNHYGATESGPIAPIFFPDQDYDYRYFRLRSDLRLDLRAAPQPTDGDQRQHFILTAYPFGWDTPFELQDHLICNPARPHTEFAAVGRKDDMIVLATGEKALPGMLETSLIESPAIRSALAFGEGRFEIGVLIQPTTEMSHNQVEAFKDHVWTLVEEVNQRMDAHARITSKDSILLVSPTAPLPRSDKGSLLRREIYKVFAAEIDGVYQGLEAKNLENLKRPLRWEQLEHDIKTIVQHDVGWNIAESGWSVNDDLFDLGLDSLQALRLRRVLLASVPILDTDARSSSKEEIVSRNFVYQNPSVSRMAKALKGAQSSESDDTFSVDQIVEQYRVLPSSTQVTVLITGATGSLGAHVLAHLVSLENVERVICLDRPKVGVDASARLQAALRDKDLHIEPYLWEQKVQALQSITALPALGLPAETYKNLQGTVTHILHAAWPMDFKRTLVSFKSSFQTLQNLLQLAHEARCAQPTVHPSFLFISSIATVGNASAVTGDSTVVEEPAAGPACALSLGYAQAKLACEKLLQRTASTAPLAGEVRVRFARVGQLSSNSRTGFWNPVEHFPALAKTSQEIGALPRLAGTLSWIPVDVAARAVGDILLLGAEDSTDLGIYHIENPVRQAWSDVMRSLATRLGLDQETALLPYGEWLGLVAERAGPASPARRLLDFFEGDFLHMACGGVVLDTYRARKASPALRQLGAVGDEQMDRVVEYWRSVHFIH
ncbi:putative NRPS-like enzyme [Macrophomina phaseolina]|uniref:NRPS-like enzyme n=1 Tax=Macrophomina phaseolina TaxID=35725 RepID=A0ABQ8G570_9PEZI|nr:putative NRPS-like enzyme [Macrophomina phaseolina]